MLNYTVKYACGEPMAMAASHTTPIMPLPTRPHDVLWHVRARPTVIWQQYFVLVVPKYTLVKHLNRAIVALSQVLVSLLWLLVLAALFWGFDSKTPPRLQ